MPEKKKQHYVPRFYLKSFSHNNIHINLFNITSLKSIYNVPLDSQCQKDYFYGNDGKLENALQELESKSSVIINNIIINQVFPDNDDDFMMLYLYIYIQSCRTKYSSDRITESFRYYDRTYNTKLAEEMEGVSPATISIFNHLKFASIIHDLKPILVISDNVNEFYTSDNPVVLYNKLMEFRKQVSNTGFACKGLIIIFPLSPNITIMLYDASSYKITIREKDIIHADKKYDIDEFNKLQILSAYENIYYKNPKLDILSLYNSCKFNRRFNKEINGEIKQDGKEYIAVSTVDIRAKFTLSFFGLKKSAKQWRDAYMKLKHKPIQILRNTNLFDYVHHYNNEVSKFSIDDSK